MEIDSYYILCPYCKSQCGDWESFSSDSNDESQEFECEDCDKKFEGERVVTVDYRTEKDCELNNESHEKGEYHCTKCDVYNPHIKDVVKENKGVQNGNKN